ncbi:MAG: hypothetical protein JWM82_980 [Myxococcales bacterium]|nr:hypothetical protein [Myxococcales bacterium]
MKKWSANRHWHLWGVVVLSAGLGALSGCGDAPLSTDAGPDGDGQVSGSDGNTGADAGGAAPDGGPGTKVWTADATKLVAKVLGDGFGPAPTPTAPCVRGFTYTLTMSDRKLSWRLCNDAAADPAMALRTGERVLSTAELAGVVAALDTVVVSHGTGCGADKSTETLTITTPAGERDFFDDFYACNATPGRTYVANIDSVFAALNALAN